MPADLGASPQPNSEDIVRTVAVKLAKGFEEVLLCRGYRIRAKCRPYPERATDPAEITGVVVFLASGRASYMTGTTVDVTGGMLMR